MWHFLFGPFHFWTNLIRFRFLIFPDTSGRAENFFLGQVEAEKLAASGGKNQANTSRGTVFMTETKKKALFILPLPTSSENNNDFLVFVGSVGSIFYISIISNFILFVTAVFL